MSWLQRSGEGQAVGATEWAVCMHGALVRFVAREKWDGTTGNRAYDGFVLLGTMSQMVNVTSNGVFPVKISLRG